MKLLTERQKEVLEFIERYISTKPYPPTIREVADSFTMSVKGAYDHIKAIERKGYIKVGENRSRTIEIVGRQAGQAPTVEVPVLGAVAAGKPIFADENFESSMHVPASMTGTARCFALRVRGDSMVNAGILDGDVAVIEQRAAADNGDIVVAMIEDSVTLKRYSKEKGRFKLSPENPNHSPIFTQDIRILGRLRGIIRTY